MESNILEAQIGLFETIQALLEADKELELSSSGCMRPGGHINLDKLGDDVWTEQFRYSI